MVGMLARQDDLVASGDLRDASRKRADRRLFLVAERGSQQEALDEQPQGVLRGELDHSRTCRSANRHGPITALGAISLPAGQPTLPTSRVAAMTRPWTRLPSTCWCSARVPPGSPRR